MSSINWIAPGQNPPPPTTAKSAHTAYVKKLLPQQRYPPAYYFMTESKQSAETWAEFFRKCPLTDKDPHVNQSGMSFILPRRLQSSLENGKKQNIIKRKVDSSGDEKEKQESVDGKIEDNEAPEYLVHAFSVITLDHADVKKIPRPTMPMPRRKLQSGQTTEKVYEKEKHAVYLFLQGHAYEDQKKWTKDTLREEIQARNSLGRNIHWADTWRRDRRIAALLEDDGVAFTVTHTIKPKNVKEIAEGSHE